MATCGATREQQAHIDALELAYEKLCLGQQVAEATDANGERVRYNQGDKDGLARYIYRKKIEYGITTVTRPMKGFL